MNLAGKVAIVSGAARGLGRAFAESLGGAGAAVVAFDKQPEVLDVAAAATLVADVSSRADVVRVIDAATGVGGVDILVNNAATWRPTPVDSSWQQTLDDWDFIMDTNLKGVMLLSRAAVPHMISGGGDIVNIANQCVLPATEGGANSPDTDLYNASKWALNGFTDAWAKYLQRYDIRVNALCIGAVDTNDITQLLLELLADGRSGENIGAWPGKPVSLGPRKPAHKRITG